MWKLTAVSHHRHGGSCGFEGVDDQRSIIGKNRARLSSQIRLSESLGLGAWWGVDSGKRRREWWQKMPCVPRERASSLP